MPLSLATLTNPALPRTFDPSANPGLLMSLASLSQGIPTAPEAANAQPRTLGDLQGAQTGQPVRTLADASTAEPRTLADLSAAGALDMPKLKEKKGPLGLSSKQWAAMLAAAGDALTAYSGAGRTNTLGAFMQAQEADAEREFELQKQNRPRLEQVGNTLGWVNPAAGSYSPIFTAPSAAEQYASALGFEPGTDDFKSAVQDYRLGSWSDPAMEQRLTLEDVRYKNRDSLQDERLGVTRRGQDLRYRATTRGQDLTHGDRQATIHQSDTNNRRTTQTSRDNAQLSAQTRLQSGGRRRGSAEPVAVGPHGERLVVRNGAWVDANTGRPVQ